MAKKIVEVVRPDGLAIIDSLRAGDKGIRTSLGANYNNAIFGRDSSIVGDILTTVNPHITGNIILALARLQGVRYEKATNEEPGRIMHEYRKYQHWETGALKKVIFKAIARLWGGDSQRVITYYSMDSTPLYVLMVADYAQLKPEVLDMRITRYDGKAVTIRQTVIEACEWMMRQVNSEGLVEVPRGNFFSLMNQTWKDSPTGYIQPDGTPLDITRPVAYLEMQGLVSEALSRATNIVDTEEWRHMAKRLRATIAARFWREDEQYFASAIQYNKHGQTVVTTLESDPGWLLNTGVFDDFNEEEQKKYISGIVRRLFSPDFLTDAGVRARALRYRKKLALSDYHGSYTTWPIDSYMFSRGLRRHNLPLLADQLDARVIDAINKSGDFYEYFFVDANDRVVYDPQAAATPFHRHVRQRVITLLPALMPESNIAWTVALGLELRHEDSRKNEHHPQKRWQSQLEAEVLHTIRPFPLKKILATQEQPVPDRPPIILARKTGEVVFAGQIVGMLKNAAIERLEEKMKRGLGALAHRALEK